jgi:putative SOS response-associated peptidase YedK
LIPADGFYEWKKTPDGKIPYSLEMKDGSPFVFAGFGMAGRILTPKSGYEPA